LGGTVTTALKRSKSVSQAVVVVSGEALTKATAGSMAAREGAAPVGGVAQAHNIKYRVKIRIRIELTFGRLQRATFREKGIFARAMTTEDGQEKSGLFIAGFNSERARGHFCRRAGLLLTCLLVCQRPKNWRLFFTGRIEPVFSAWVTLSVEI